MERFSLDDGEYPAEEVDQREGRAHHQPRLPPSHEIRFSSDCRYS
jgi:hypothetical protein